MKKTRIVRNLDGTRTEYDEIPIRAGTLGGVKGFNGPLKRIQGKSEKELGTLISLCRDLFVENWDQIRFGPCIEGAVFEISMRRKPELFSMLDGYLTVELPHAKDHFHLCLSETRGLGKQKTPRAQAKVRQCGRAAFVRTVGKDGCTPRAWSIRLWNGKGEQMATVFLPNPHLSGKLEHLKKPDWSRLELWNDLRRKYIGEKVPQPLPADVPMLEHA